MSCWSCCYCCYFCCCFRFYYRVRGGNIRGTSRSSGSSSSSSRTLQDITGHYRTLQDITGHHNTNKMVKISFHYWHSNTGHSTAGASIGCMFWRVSDFWWGTQISDERPCFWIHHESPTSSVLRDSISGSSDRIHPYWCVWVALSIQNTCITTFVYLTQLFILYLC